MKYQPNETELAEVNSYDVQERLHYFLTRTIESEEVWGLSNASGWVMKEVNELLILPVWPYENMASNCRLDEWKDYSANAVSLEHFVYNILPAIIKKDIKLEIQSTKANPGTIMTGAELSAIFEGMLESGEYYMEG